MPTAIAAALLAARPHAGPCSEPDRAAYVDALLTKTSTTPWERAHNGRRVDVDGALSLRLDDTSPFRLSDTGSVVLRTEDDVIAEHRELLSACTGDEWDEDPRILASATGVDAGRITVTALHRI